MTYNPFGSSSSDDERRRSSSSGTGFNPFAVAGGYSPSATTSDAAAAAQARATQQMLAAAFEEQSSASEGGWLGNAFDQAKAMVTGLDDAVKLGGRALGEYGSLIGKGLLDPNTYAYSFTGGRAGEWDELEEFAKRDDTASKEIIEGTLESYDHLYSPLLNGDFDEFRKRWKQEPLSPILDVIGIASLGAGATAKVAATSARAGEGGAIAGRAASIAGLRKIENLPTSGTARSEAIAQAEARSGREAIIDRAGNAYVPKDRTVLTPKGVHVQNLRQRAATGDTDAQLQLDAIDTTAGLERVVGTSAMNPLRRLQQSNYDRLSQRLPGAPIIGAEKRARSLANRESRAAKSRATDSKVADKATRATTRLTGAVASVRANPILAAAYNTLQQGVTLRERIGQLSRDAGKLELDARKPQQVRRQADEIREVVADAERRVVEEGLEGAEAAARREELIAEGARNRAEARRAKAEAGFSDRVDAAEGKVAAVSGKWVRESDVPEHLRDRVPVREVDGQRLVDANALVETARKEARRAERELALIERRAQRKSRSGDGKQRQGAAAARSAWLTAAKRELQEARAELREARRERRGRAREITAEARAARRTNEGRAAAELAETVDRPALMKRRDRLRRGLAKAEAEAKAAKRKRERAAAEARVRDTRAKLAEVNGRLRRGRKNELSPEQRRAAQAAGAATTRGALVEGRAAMGPSREAVDAAQRRVDELQAEVDRVAAMTPDEALREWAQGAARGMNPENVRRVGELLGSAGLRANTSLDDVVAEIARRQVQSRAAVVASMERLMGGAARYQLVGKGPGRGTRAVSVADRAGELTARADEIRGKRNDALQAASEFNAELQRVADDPSSAARVLEDLEQWEKALGAKDLLIPRMTERIRLLEAAEGMSKRERKLVAEAMEQMGPLLDVLHETTLSTGVSADVARRLTLAQITVGRKLEDLTTEGVKIVPHTIEGAALRSSVAQANTSRVAKPGRTSSMRRNTGMSFRFAMDSTDPRVIAQTLETNAEFKAQMRMYDEIADQVVGVPNTMDPPPGFVRIDEGKISNMRTAYRNFRERADVVFGNDHHVLGMMNERLDRFFDGVDSRTGRGTYPVVPERYARMLDYELDKSTHALGRAFDRTTGVWRWTTLALRPAWSAANFVGNAILLAMSHASADGFRAMAKSMTPEARRVFASKGGALRMAGPSEVLRESIRMAEGQRHGRKQRGVKRIKGRDIPLAKMMFNLTPFPHIGRMNLWFNQAADDVFRRAAFVAEVDGPASRLAAREGISWGEAAERVLQDPSTMGRVEQRVLSDMIDFQDLSRIEKQTIRRVSPFVSWLKGMTRRQILFVLDHPVVTAGWNRMAQDFGAGPFEFESPDFLQGAIPMPDKLEQLLGVGEGDEHEGVFVTQAFNPLQTPVDVMEQLRAIVDPSVTQPTGGDNPLAATNPLFRAPIEAMTGRDAFSGEEIPSDSISGRLWHQGLRSTPLSSSYYNYTDAINNPEYNDRKLFRASPQVEFYKWLGIPARDVNVTSAESMGNQRRQSIIVDYPTLRTNAQGETDVASYYRDPRTGAIMRIAPYGFAEDDGE